jgi:hypothetical protein
MRCGGEDQSVVTDPSHPTEVVETDGTIIITKDNAHLYVEVEINVLTLQNQEYKETFDYSHQLKLKNGVICVSDIQVNYLVNFVITYEYYDTEYQINRTSTTLYEFQQVNIVFYQQSVSNVTQAVGYFQNTIDYPENLTILSIESSYEINGAYGSALLDNNYQP